MQHLHRGIVIVAEKRSTEPYKPMHLELVELCRRGDRKAQFEIYRLYHAAMFNTTLRIVGDPDDAEDVMQEAFLKAFAKIRTYRGEVSFGAWLKKIVVNKSLDFLRLRKDQLSLEEVGEIEMIDDEPSDSPEAEATPRVEEIREAIRMLPEGYRIVLSLILLEGYDHEEVSEILGISNATSRTQYHRAKKKLQELIELKKWDR
ncbi:MAG: RNA polymerase sigma factor [Bacteroidales bacterium]